MKHYKILGKATLVALCFCSGLVWAQNVNIATHKKPKTLNPLHENSVASWTVVENVFHTLIVHDSELGGNKVDSGNMMFRNAQGAIKSFESSAANKLILNLREDIVFHDGSKLGADDVIYSINQLLSNEDKSPFWYAVSRIEKLTKINDQSLELTLSGSPEDTLRNLGDVFIIKKESIESPIGSGPYMIESFEKNLDSIRLVKAKTFNGKQYEITSANFVHIENKKNRIEKFVNGGIDIIEHVALKDIESMGKEDDLNISSNITNTTIYLSMDQLRDSSPHITRTDGTKLDSNPFKMKEVREAISLTIDKQQLVLENDTVPSVAAYQFLPEKHEKYLRSVSNEKAPDVKKALKLMKKAGYSDGFTVALHVSERRKPAAAIIANMLKNININVKVTAIPRKEFEAFANSFEYSFLLKNALIYEPSGWIQTVFLSYNKDKKSGLYNYSRYSNSIMDEIGSAIELATTDAERDALEAQAMQLMMDEKGYIPLYHLSKIWGAKKPFKYNAYQASSTVLPSIGVINK